jgi:acyl-CoA thioester hydrolase
MFTTHLRVRWSEVDMQKVVFNGHYLNYFDVAFTDYWRSLGLPTGEAQQSSGHEMFAKKATVEYLAAAKFEDYLRMTVHSTHLGHTSARFEINIWRDNVQSGVAAQHIVRGELVYVFVETAKMRPVPWPQGWRAVLAPLILVSE